MSTHARPDSPSVLELTRLVRALGEELAGYRKRALTAEARLRTLEERVVQVTGVSSERVVELEQENADLLQRVAAARERTTRMLARVRFLKQQREGGGGTP